VCLLINLHNTEEKQVNYTFCGTILFTTVIVYQHISEIRFDAAPPSNKHLEYIWRSVGGDY